MNYSDKTEVLNLDEIKFKKKDKKKFISVVANGLV